MAPFDANKLTRLMTASGVDLLLASTRHNIRYLTGGYYFHFVAQATRAGQSQYLPFVGLPRGRAEDAFYVGRVGERGQIEAEHLWIRDRMETPGGTLPPIEQVVRTVGRLGLEGSTIAVEMPFLPADAFLALRRGLPKANLVDATPILDELRAIKTAEEIARLRRVHDRVAEAIQAGFAAGRRGLTTAEIAGEVRREMARRDVTFLFAFTCAGPGTLRAPSSVRWEPGQVLHIDAGGEEGDYLADICRMGCFGKPSPLAQKLYTACLSVQGQVEQAIRPGLPCGELHTIGERGAASGGDGFHGRFVAHGIGMVSHEAPDVSANSSRLLEPGMVLSIETEFIHRDVGHVKIEDTVAVTNTGCEGLGELGREWQ